MQSGWLDQFHRRVAEAPKTEPETPVSEETPDEVSRRAFLQSGLATGVTAGLAAGGLLAQTQVAQAQAAGDTPLGPKWWPSKWGPQDEAGASNLITPAKVLEAAKLIKTGKIYELGRMYESAMPLFGIAGLRPPHTRHADRAGRSARTGSSSTTSSCHRDRPGRDAVRRARAHRLHHGQGRRHDRDAVLQRLHRVRRSANAYGLQKLGIENCKPFFTRGVLVDVAGLKGRMLNMGEEISVADVQAALQRQGIAESSIQPGDGVFFHTGWSSLWMKDNAKFNQGEPGIGLDVARWCVAKQVALVGAGHLGDRGRAESESRTWCSPSTTS